MGGGLMQLVAYGAQDVYLTGNPQITLFKVVYRRHTNFSMECIELPIDTLKPSGRTTVQILRNGDLASKTYLRVVLPDISGSTGTWNGSIAWVHRLGHAMIKSAELQIGGSPIDKHWGTWLDIWYELTHTNSQDAGYNAMIGDIKDLTTLTLNSAIVTNTPLKGGYTLHVPMQFWFCRNYGLALPLIALQYHEVRLNLEMQDLSYLLVYTNGTGASTAPSLSSLAYGSSGLLIDYIYLDSEERRRFAQVGHEYLIEQVQLNEANITAVANQTFTLNFNHPCKELIWAHRTGAFNGSDSATRFLAYTADTEDEDGWDLALQTAAQNLVQSMVLAATTVAPATLGSPTVAEAIAACSPITASQISTYTIANVLVAGTGTSRVTEFTFTSGATLMVVTMTTATGKTLVLNFVSTLGATSQVQYVYLNINSLVDAASSNLAQYISNATVYLTFSGVAGATTAGFANVVAEVELGNTTLTLDELSVPVSKFTDNRLKVTTPASGVSNTWGYNYNDVHVVQLNNYGVRLDGKGNMVSTGNLVLNGHDRFALRTGTYFNNVQPYQHHTHTPAQGINVYSFGLHPEQHQPSGTCNMSRIDSARLVYTLADPFVGKRTATFDLYTGTIVDIWVTNYNVLRIMSGMGGLAYSN
jgi:Large eukaryotic DNA virus major capsid protein.